MDVSVVGVPSRTARIFLSYKRNIEPDQSLAAEMVAALSKAGHAVFIDQRLVVGQAWAREIEQQVRASDYLVVFLTEESSRSEMVRGEIELARQHAALAGSPQILPVRVAFDKPLPYPLSAYLDKIQYATWTTAADTSRLVRELLAAIAGDPDALATASAIQPSTPPEPPPYAAQLPPPGGTLTHDDPWYLPRDSDKTALGLIALSGQTMTIKGPRQMGKSSLLMRTVKAALDLDKKVALIDFQLFDEESKGDADVFFRRFASSIVDALELHDGAEAVDDVWDSGLSNPLNCTRYMERQILQRIEKPCVLAIDETDAVFQTAFSADFFAMLRTWHGLRANPTRRSWKQLDLIMSTSTEPQFFIDRPHESPFNVGANIALEDFTPWQVYRLNGLHPRPMPRAEVDSLYGLINGHPYLTRKAFYMVAGSTPQCSLDELFGRVIDDSGPFGDHLRFYLLKLHRRPELLAAFKRILGGRSCGDELLAYRLQAAGLVRRDHHRVVPRCELYASYFRERLYECA